ncbi:uncharacterized protein [Miscanthus floridulus]|uniref:uncharacterized protein n=1 Tax=Miscanthus floridulus TaxID=154761 RepID=UPI00345835D2
MAGGPVILPAAPWEQSDVTEEKLHQTLLVGDPPLAPRKALKVNVSSSAHQAAEAQAGARRGAASGETVSEEAAAQEKEAEAAVERVGEEEPVPRDVVGLGAKEAGASAVAEATKGEAGAPKTSDVTAVDAGAIEPDFASDSEPQVEIPRLDSTSAAAKPTPEVSTENEEIHDSEASETHEAEGSKAHKSDETIDEILDELARETSPNQAPNLSLLNLQPSSPASQGSAKRGDHSAEQGYQQSGSGGRPDKRPP